MEEIESLAENLSLVVCLNFQTLPRIYAPTQPLL
jgi:hypothetical protein